jgi:hypothetical protein
MNFKYIQYFILSFIVGMACVYISPVEYKTVVVYPTLNNLNKIQYKDSAQNCFKFRAKLVDCTKNAKVISVQ